MSWIIFAVIGFSLVSRSFELQFTVAYNFMNKTGSSGIFQPWMAARSGNIKLNFKAFDTDGLIFFVGDNNDPNMAGNYMYLKLEWGVAVLVTQVHYFSEGNEENKIEERIRLGKNLDDGKWHGINVERRGSYTIFKVDKETATLKLADRISNLRIASYLYLGGIPERYLDPICKQTKERFPRFLGCIKDLGYGEGSFFESPRMIDSEYLDQREMCIDACQPSNKCRNGGKCQNLFHGYKCDCLGTGFEGQFCERASPSLTLDGLGYVQLDSRTVSNETDIALGFKTRARKGIIFGVGSPTSYIVAEVLNERVGVSVKLKTGTKESIILRGDRVNDNIWHFLRITRRKQEIRVALDKRFEQSKILSAIDDNDAILDSVHLGGAWNTAKIFPGFTQTKFCGCITQAYYNGVDTLSLGQYKGSARRTGICMKTQCTRK